MEKIKEFFLKNYSLTTLAIRNLIFSLILLLILNYINVIDLFLFINFNTIFYIIIFLIFVLFFLFFEKEKKKESFEKYFKTFFLTGLFLITLISIGFENVEGLNELILLVESFQLYILVFTIFCGFFTFYFNSEKVEKEKKIKNLYYNICLLLIIILGFILRIWNLNILDPYTDEYMHLYAGLQILEGSIVEYTRALLVSYSVGFFYWLGSASDFYEYLYWGRIPGVIFGTLTIIPIYLLAKKINPTIALLSGFLWATSPWAIGVSRTVREYTYYPFFILIACYVLIYLIDSLFSYKKEILKKIILSATYVLGLLIYALFIDTLSTLKIGLLILLVISFYQVFLNVIKNKDSVLKLKKQLPKIIILSALILIPILLYTLNSTHIKTGGVEAKTIWLNYFMQPSGSPMHWWYNNPIELLPYLLLFLGFFYSLFKKNWGYFLHFSIFAILIFFYVFLFDRYVRPRYIFYVLPFFIILLSSSVYSLFHIIGKTKLQILNVFAIITISTFLISTFNYKNILYPSNSNTHGYILTTDEYHDNIKSTMKFLDGKITKDDVFVATIITYPLMISYGIEEEKTHHYMYTSEERFDDTKRFIQENPQGFMILDSRRNGGWEKGYPHEGEFLIGETILETITNENGFQIYRWNNFNK